jgi:hypothetical protein
MHRQLYTHMAAAAGGAVRDYAMHDIAAAIT